MKLPYNIAAIAVEPISRGYKLTLLALSNGPGLSLKIVIFHEISTSGKI